MRVVGRRISPPLGLHWPTPEEIRFMSGKPPGSVLVVGRRGAARYRSHEEADGEMREIIGERMAAQARKLVHGP